MREVLRRIAIHGALTAIILGIVGFMFAELASIWLSGSPGTRAKTGDPIESTDREGTVSTELRDRVPIMMAVWGFAFVAACELFLHWLRARRKKTPVAPPPPDEAEKLLEEILSQVESRVAAKPEPEATVQPTASISEHAASETK
jgi:hypothetical protein